jgi:PBP1b-binding outer membrane lipoprotein LpoB
MPLGFITVILASCAGADTATSAVKKKMTEETALRLIHFSFSVVQENSDGLYQSPSIKIYNKQMSMMRRRRL